MSGYHAHGTRPPCITALEQPLVPFVFSEIGVPTAGFAGRLVMFDLELGSRRSSCGDTHALRERISGASSECSIARRRASNAAPVLDGSKVSMGESDALAANDALAASAGAPDVATVFVAANDTGMDAAADPFAAVRPSLNGISTYSPAELPAERHSCWRSVAESVCTSPTATESGVTPPHPVLTAVTVMTVCADLSLIIAVIVADPALTPVTSPFATVATPEADVLQVTVSPTSAFPEASIPEALSVVVCPTAMTLDGALMATEATGAGPVEESPLLHAARRTRVASRRRMR